jgi:hypothetical protein
LPRFLRKKKRVPSPLTPEIALVSPKQAVCFRLPVGIAFGSLLVAQLAWVVPTRFDSRSDAELIDRVQSLPMDRLATVFSAWEQKGKPDKTTRDRLSPFGKYSIMAGFQVGDQSASLELDYPFFGWHNLTNCYALRGWEVQSSKTLDTQLPGQHEGSTVEQSLARGLDEKAYLLYSIHDSAGRILKRPEKGPSSRWLQAHMLSPRGLNIHLCSLFGVQIGDDQVFSAEPEWFMPTLQIQVLVRGLKAPDEATKKQARLYFDSARDVLLRELSSSKESKP